MEPQPNPESKETIMFTGKIGEVVHIEQSDGRIFEQYRRPPGTRLIIVSPDNKVLITKERRHETGNVDLRLPGGKVCNTIEEFRALKNSGQDILKAAKAGAIKEAVEETGLIIKNPELVAIANAGATVNWDLYYFLVHEYEQNPAGQALEHGEDIEVTWMSPEQIRQAISDGQMQEWRSVGVLLGKVLPSLESS